MKIKRGSYPGASDFAEFDIPVVLMSREQKEALLSAILHLAMPGEEHCDVVYRALEIAERLVREQGVAI
jgi:hypothetical protein